jgi:hypothetical protein
MVDFIRSFSSLVALAHLISGRVISCRGKHPGESSDYDNPKQRRGRCVGEWRVAVPGSSRGGRASLGSWNWSLRGRISLHGRLSLRGLGTTSWGTRKPVLSVGGVTGTPNFGGNELWSTGIDGGESGRRRQRWPEERETARAGVSADATVDSVRGSERSAVCHRQRSDGAQPVGLEHWPCKD